MNNWIYIGAVLFGAFSLLIEADRNYRTTLNNHPFPYHAILAKVELQNLCTPREWMSGFLFYSLLYLLTYAVILSSTELFLLVRNANLAELQIGAHTDVIGPLSDPMELSDTTYGKPIFVSAFLIAFLSMGAMKPVETYMRALAHRLAGVPRGVYKVLERLQNIDYLKLNAKHPSPLLKKFNQLIDDAGFKDVSDQYTADIRAQLSVIDCLSPSVTAGFSRLHFPLTHFDAFKEVPEQLADEITQVEDLIDDLEPNEAALKTLHQHAVLASNSAKAVFAVFYVRNNHAIKNTQPKSPIATIETQIARGYRTELNSFAMSMFVGVLVSMGVVFFAYHWDRGFKVENKPLLAETEIRQAWDKAAPEQALTLRMDATVQIKLADGTTAKVTLPKGTDATEVLDTGESKTTSLSTDKAAEITLSATDKAKLPLLADTKVTITQIPEIDLIAQSSLDLGKMDGADSVILPAQTRGYFIPVKDMDFAVPVQGNSTATVQLENGKSATTEVGGDTQATVTLKKGIKVEVAFPTDTPARPYSKETGTAVSFDLPTWPTCLAALKKAESDRKGKDGKPTPKTEETAIPDDPCSVVTSQGTATWLANQFPRFVKWSLWDVLQRGLMIFGTVVATIFFREVRVDQNAWKPWSFKRIPFLRLLSMSFAPALIGVFALSSAFVIQLIWDADFNVTQRQITVLFQTHWIYFAWHLLPCMILSIAALILMDKHDDWPVEITIGVGTVFGLILITVSFLVYVVNNPGGSAGDLDLPSFLGGGTLDQKALRDTIVTATLPALFIFLFAAFLELTEDNQADQWLILRVLAPPIKHFKSLTFPRGFKTLLYLLGIAALAALLWSFTAVILRSETPAPASTVKNTGDTPDILLRIGVRSDARPFSYQSERNFDVLTAATPGPLAKDKYTGFMVKICDAVLNDLLVNPIVPERKADPKNPDRIIGPAVRLKRENIKIVNVDKLIAKNKEISRFTYFGNEKDPTGKFDILCDPSTITNERRAGFILSPPLFLSGISFIDLPDLPKPKQDECPKNPLIGLVGNTTAANSGIRAILKAGELPSYRRLLIDWLDDGKSKCSKDRDDYEAVEVFRSHSAAAKSFCAGGFHYYLGDQEIIAYSARQVPGCEFDQAGRTFTNDRYAIFGKIDYDNPARGRWVARFFEVLSQKVLFSPSILDTAFSDTFIGTEKSRALELFFWSVRGAH